MLDAILPKLLGDVSFMVRVFQGKTDLLAKLPVRLTGITTEGAETDRNRAMKLGAAAYLVKPVQSQQVVGAVRRLLRLP